MKRLQTDNLTIPYFFGFDYWDNHYMGKFISISNGNNFKKDNFLINDNVY